MECLVCEGLGYHDKYYNEFDCYEIECVACEGKGIELDTVDLSRIDRSIEVDVDHKIEVNHEK